MKVLIACEESQILAKAFRELGVMAFSNDILPAGGGYPEIHLQMDALEALRLHKWAAVIAFPPCTDLSVSGARWFAEKRANGSQQRSVAFFMEFANYPGRRSIENPIGIMSSLYKKPTQIIQPWQFGHGETKATCLWLQGLPKLEPTNIVAGREQRVWKMPPSEDRAKLRSKTFKGIAQAMASQWAPIILNP